MSTSRTWSTAFGMGPSGFPSGFSIVAVLLLAPALVLRVRGRGRSFARHAGLVVGYASIAVGLAGVVYHLDSQFFSQWTIRSLVYTAPFVAPVAYAGLGFLLLVNRTVPCRDAEWSQWVVFFALGGFVGNFVLSLCDHAMNGFFHPTEWLPVFASAVAVGFLGVALVEQHRSFLRISVAVLALQIVTGVAGFYFHLVADINGLSSSLFREFRPRGAGVRPLAVRRSCAPRDDRVMGHAERQRSSSGPTTLTRVTRLRWADWGLDGRIVFVERGNDTDLRRGDSDTRHLTPDRRPESPRSRPLVCYGAANVAFVGRRRQGVRAAAGGRFVAVIDGRQHFALRLTVLMKAMRAVALPAIKNAGSKVGRRHTSSVIRSAAGRQSGSFPARWRRTLARISDFAVVPYGQDKSAPP